MWSEDERMGYILKDRADVVDKSRMGIKRGRVLIRYTKCQLDMDDAARVKKERSQDSQDEWGTRGRDW